MGIGCLVALCTVSGIAFVRMLEQRRTVVAEWVYVHTREAIVTNSVGKVVQPEAKVGPGCYEDPRKWPADCLEEVLEPRSRQKLEERFLAKRPNADHAVSNAVSWAFSSAAYTMTDEPISIVRLTVRSESGDIALSVLSVLADNLKRRAEEFRRMCEERVVAIVRLKIKRALKRGEDVEELRREEWALLEGARQNSHRIHTLVEPHIVK